MEKTKRGLGRGLDSLLGVFLPEEDEIKAATKPANTARASVANNNGVEMVDINLIYPNPNQPRKNFDEEALKELSKSIKTHGIIQPIVLNDEGGKYMIIAGERRYRASKMAGLHEVPCVIKNYTPKQVKEISIIENLQREDLNPIEAGRAIKELMQEYDLTQEQVADRIGKSRPLVANTLRLLTLEKEVIALIENNKLTAGHAKCLVAIEDKNKQIALANMAVKNKISVRDLEKAVKKLQNTQAEPKKPTTQNLELRDFVQKMQRTLATKVSLIGNENKGRIYIDYYTRDDLDRISELMDLATKNKLTLLDLQNFNRNNKPKQ